MMACTDYSQLLGVFDLSEQGLRFKVSWTNYLNKYILFDLLTVGTIDQEDFIMIAMELCLHLHKFSFLQVKLSFLAKINRANSKIE